MLPTTLSSEPRPAQPLILPRYIFLCGDMSDDERRELTDLIVTNTLSTLADSFDSILADSAAALLSSGHPLLDDTPTPFGVSFKAFRGWLRTALQNAYGMGALGDLGVSICAQQDDLWDNFLWVDVTHVEQIIPFLQRYGADDCLCLIKNYSRFPLSRATQVADAAGEHLLLVSGWKNPDELLTILRSLPRRPRFRPHVIANPEGSAA